jgi:hypothetical protein
MCAYVFDSKDCFFFPVGNLMNRVRNSQAGRWTICVPRHAVTHITDLTVHGADMKRQPVARSICALP